MILRVWDFHPGDDEIQWVDEAIKQSYRVILVLPPEYFTSKETLSHRPAFPLPVIWTVPHQRNPFFLGRDDVFPSFCRCESIPAIFRNLKNSSPERSNSSMAVRRSGEAELTAQH